jgi:hypothetical protein
MRGRNDARDIHDCDCVSLHRSGNHAFRDFSSLRTHFRAAYCMRLLYVDMGHVNYKFERKTKTGRRLPRTRNFLPSEQKAGISGLHVSQFALSSQSFWKRGSSRSGSNSGSSRSRAGVSPRGILNLVPLGVESKLLQDDDGAVGVATLRGASAIHYFARLPLARVHCFASKTFCTRAWKRGSLRTLS